MMSTGAQQIARGAAATFVGYAGKVARPIALALFARLYGLDALGVALLVWAWVELVSRVAGLGLDRGLQRFIPATATDEQAAAVAAALAAAGLSSVVAAVIVAALAPGAVGVTGDDAWLVQAAIVVMLPLLTVAVTALHAVRGTRQIMGLVWGRSVVEPVGFLLAGLAVAPFAREVPALLFAYAASIAGVAAVAVVALSRTFGLHRLARAARAPGAWPLCELLRFSIPLGVADVVNLALLRGDVLLVGVYASAATTGAYAVAREIVTSLSKIRQGFDQVLAPVAAELHVTAQRRELVAAARMAARWGAVIAAPLALAMMIFPEAVLSLFGVADGAVAVALGFLAFGRLLDAATGPTSVLLAMVGRPRLVLFDAVVALAVAAAVAAALGPWLGPVGVAIAASAGLVVANLLALYWLDRFERLRPVDAGLAAPAAVAVVAGLALGGVRLAAGAALSLPVIAAVAVWLVIYLFAAISLGLLEVP